MSECDNCNRNICHGCPYQEPDKTLAERFADNLEIGWDYAVEMLECVEVDCVIHELIEIYWRDGKCHELRQYVIKEILKRLEATER